MNKEQLLAWAVKNVTTWGSRGIGMFEYPQNELIVVWFARTGCEELALSTPGADWHITRGEWEAASVFQSAPLTAAPVTPITAHSILEAAGGHMRDRAATYDKPEGERSMGATVEAFRAITGHKLTEEQGWLFMVCLKLVRGVSDKTLDSQEDLVAYAALMGECKARSLNEEHAT